MNETISIAEFARLVGTSRRQALDLVNEDKIPSIDYKRLDPYVSVPAYVARIKDPLVNKTHKSSEIGGADYQEERTRLTKAKADKEEILAAIAKADAISVEDAKEAATSIGASVQSQIKSLRAVLPPMLEGQTPQQMTKTIAKQTDKILLALSDASLAIYKPKRKAT